MSNAMKHTTADIKATNAKLAARHLIQVNRLLSDVREANNPEWRTLKMGCYLIILDIVHINGRSGSLVAEYDEAAELSDLDETYAAASGRLGY